MALTEEERAEKLRQLAELKARRGAPPPAVAAAAAAAPPKRVAHEPTWIDRTRAGLQGLTLGGSDEIGAGIAAGAAWLGDDTGKGFGDIYDEMHQGLQDDRETYERDNGGEAFALNLLGGIATGGAGMGRVAGSKLLAKSPALVKALAAGAAEGGVAGALSADQGERLKGAALGATVGTLLPTAAAGGRGLTNAVAKRRVGREIIDEAGNVTPLNIADAEGKLGAFYRGYVGKALGGAGAIQRQSRPFLDEAEAGVLKAADNLDLKKDTARIFKEGAQDEAAATAARNAARVDKTVSLAKSRAAAQNAAEDTRLGTATRAAGRETIATARAKAAQIDDATFRQAVNEGMPPTMSPKAQASIREVPPQRAIKLLDEWWKKHGFQMVKGRSFDWDDGLRKNIRDILAEDADMAINMSGAVGKVDSMVAKLQGAGSPGSAMSSADDILEGMLDTKIVGINGDALMEMRNQFAKAANRATKSNNLEKARRYQKVKAKFDDMIRKQLGDDAALFDDELGRWGAVNVAGKSMDKAATKGGLPTAENVLAAAKSNSPRAARYGEATMQAPAQAAKDAKDAIVAGAKEQVAQGRTALPGARAAAKAARRQETDQIVARGDKIKDKIKTRLTVDRRGARDTAADALKDARSDLQHAKTVRAGTKDLIPPKNQGVINQLAMSGLLSGPGLLTGPGGIAAGIGIARTLATPKVQQFLAGQSGLQKKLAEALRSYDAGGMTKQAVEKVISGINRQAAAAAGD